MAIGMQKPTSRSGKRKLSPIITFILVALLIVGPLRSTVKLIALTPKLTQFAVEWDERNAEIEEAVTEGQTTITVRPFTVDLADYANVDKVEGDLLQWVERYYRLKQITVSS